MPRIIYITADGAEYIVDVADRLTAMQAAVENLVPGIDADCGGSAACGTCHVYVDGDWIAKTGPADSDIERQMLELTDNAHENSRLACQIKITGALDGLVLRIPVAQH